MRWILASKSPRRCELIKYLGVPECEIIPALGPEPDADSAMPEQSAELIALAKAREVARSASPEDVVIAADTLVWLDGEHLGKPADEEQAKTMLRALSGREHTVISGIAVIHDGREYSAHESTAVRFTEMTDGEIARYVATGEPMDKAGAYGAQGAASIYIEGINGDYFNVVGLPMCRLHKLLKEAGVM